MTPRPESHAASFPWVGALVLGVFACGCERTPTPAASASRSAAPVAPATSSAGEALEPAPEATPLPTDIAPILEPFKGDLDGMLKRRVIRVLTVQNPILYSVDRGREVGITYETIKDFEKDLNKKLGNDLVGVHVIAIPVARDQLIPRLLAGEGDIAAAGLTVTPERKRQVDFSDPFTTGVRAVLVTGPNAPPVASIDELSGKDLYVRPSSSYAERLKRLNERFVAAGKPPVKITPAPEILEDGDILEMVSAGSRSAPGTGGTPLSGPHTRLPRAKRGSDPGGRARRRPFAHFEGRGFRSLLPAPARADLHSSWASRRRRSIGSSRY